MVLDLFNDDDYFVSLVHVALSAVIRNQLLGDLGEMESLTFQHLIIHDQALALLLLEDDSEGWIDTIVNALQLIKDKCTCKNGKLNTSD